MPLKPGDPVVDSEGNKGTVLRVEHWPASGHSVTEEVYVKWHLPCDWCKGTGDSLQQGYPCIQCGGTGVL